MSLKVGFNFINNSHIVFTIVYKIFVIKKAPAKRCYLCSLLIVFILFVRSQ